MVVQIPFDVITDPVHYNDIHIKNGHQLYLSGKVDLNDVEIGSLPFFVTSMERNFIIDSVLIYTKERTIQFQIPNRLQ